MLRLIVNRPVPAQPFASYKSHMADLKRFREEADRLRAEGAEMKITARQRMALEIAALYERVARYAKKRPEEPGNR
jgi:hypothetical protein